MSLSERAKRRQISEAFASFLRHDEGLYFCCGKAGSGKSTFMKFLSGHKGIHRQLEGWSGSKKLVVINIFFWNAADELQMSMEGFYRSLLFQMVQQCPETLSAIFPQHELNVNDNPEGIRGFLLPFRFLELQEAVLRLLKRTQFSRHRICLFIDGLDEFKGDIVEHFKLARSLKDWAVHDVKIICSARPYTEFLDTFTDPRRTIRLHEWTKDDIHRYVSSELHTGLEPGKRPNDSHMRFAETIARKADGVFIWARLVVRSVLEGIVHGDSIKGLHDRVDKAPRQINQLYETILDDMDPALLRRSKDALLLITRCPLPRLNALVLYWLEDLEDEEFPMNRPFQIHTTEEISRAHDIAERQLALLTRGLVEVRPLKTGEHTRVVRGPFSHYLDYHHMTARDFLTSRVGTAATSMTPDILRDRYGRLLLAEVKFCGLLWATISHWRVIYAKGNHTYHSVPDRYLDQLAECFPACVGGRQTPWSPSRHNPGVGSWLLPVPVTLSPQAGQYIHHLVWKGSYANLIMFFALSFHQAGYVLRWLKKGVVNDLTNEEVAVWLLATWTIFPDPDITEFILSHRGLPLQPLQIKSYGRGTTLTLSCWFGFLLSFLPKRRWHNYIPPRDHSFPYREESRDSNIDTTHDMDGEAQRAVWSDMQCHTLEQLLRHGVDKDVVFLLGDNVGDVAAGIHYWEHWRQENRPWDDFRFQGATYQETFWYMELATMLEMVQPPPPNLATLRELLGSSRRSNLRAAVSRVLDYIRGVFVNKPESLPAKVRCKPASPADLATRRLAVYGIASKDELFMGPLTILVY